MTDPPAPNVDLLHAVMDEILAHPELHDQQAWASRTDCGTAYCFAGLACHLSGLQPDWELGVTDGNGLEQTAYLVNGGMIEHEAARLLGIDHETAEDLFHANNDTATLKHYVDEICEHGLIRAAQTTDPWSE